jgi:hypothetical protein
MAQKILISAERRYLEKVINEYIEKKRLQYRSLQNTRELHKTDEHELELSVG